jgi:hypothetical protein
VSSIEKWGPGGADKDDTPLQYNLCVIQKTAADNLTKSRTSRKITNSTLPNRKTLYFTFIVFYPEDGGSRFL